LASAFFWCAIFGRGFSRAFCGAISGARFLIDATADRQPATGRLAKLATAPERDQSVRM